LRAREILILCVLSHASRLNRYILKSKGDLFKAHGEFGQAGKKERGAR